MKYLNEYTPANLSLSKCMTDVIRVQNSPTVKYLSAFLSGPQKTGHLRQIP